MKKIQNVLKLPALVAVLTAVGACSSLANPIVLTFEGLGDNQAIGNYYNGGAGGNLGVSFGPDSLALIQDTAGGSGNFANAPSGVTIAYFLTGVGDVMNVPAGFNTGFSFYYALQTGNSGSVSVYSGLDGTGTLLASLSLVSTPNPYTVFVPVGVPLFGTAESVVFGGDANFIGFDNITFGSSTPGTGAVPDSGTTAVMLGMGLMGLVGVSRRLAVAK